MRRPAILYANNKLVGRRMLRHDRNAELSRLAAEFRHLPALERDRWVAEAAAAPVLQQPFSAKTSSCNESLSATKQAAP